jgi:hypothetical protein
MLKKHITVTLLASAMLYVPLYSLAQETRALSTSRFVEISFKDGKGAIVKPCGGKKASFAQSYVSIGVEKLTVNKHDSLLQRIVSSDRRVFSAANLKANYKSQELSISKVGKPVSLSGADSSVDMGVEWGMVDRIPWVLQKASFEIKLGYAADSISDAIVSAFNGITSAIPGYTLSSSLATGFAITNAIDKLLFAPDRAIDLLRANRELPLLAGQLCEGFYATFSAENNSAYEKYYDGFVTWTGSDLEYRGKPINDVSYAVISVKVSDRYYPVPSAAFNDTSRGWTGKYRDVLSSLLDLIWVSSVGEIADKEKTIRSSLLEALTLLGSDLDLTQQEKSEIHAYAQNEAINALKDVKGRLTADNKITKASTEAAIASALNRQSGLVSEASASNARRILADPASNLPPMSGDLGARLSSSIKNLESVIQLR